jgi:hypothetical protein
MRPSVSITRFVCFRRVIEGAIQRILPVHVLKTAQWAMRDVDERVFGPDNDTRGRNRHMAARSCRARCVLGHDAPIPAAADFLRGGQRRRGWGLVPLFSVG